MHFCEFYYAKPRPKMIIIILNFSGSQIVCASSVSSSWNQRSPERPLGKWHQQYRKPRFHHPSNHIRK